LRIHYLQHVPFEGAAGIATWAEARGCPLTRTRLYEGKSPPTLDAFDLLAVMGGPMNVYEHGAYPWLASEREFIQRAVDGGKRVLGVCLGAQLLADALGGEVTRNAHTEIGWWPIRLTPAGEAQTLFADWPTEVTAFHWHGDTFAVPPGALHVAESDACRSQAFVFGARAVGLQCHLEYSPASIEAMVEHCADELVDGPYIQPADGFLTEPQRVEAAQALLFRLLDALAGA